MTNNKKQKKEEFETRLLSLDRVTRVRAGGKRFRFRALVAVGNKNGKVGIGLASGRDTAQAIEKATRLAQKKIIDVPIKNETIPFDIETKYHSARIFLRPQKKGRGIVAGGTIRAICQLAGIPNITAKLLSKTKNKINIARALLKAFKILKI